MEGTAEMAMLFGALLLLIYSVRIKVREDSISVSKYFVSEQKVLFTEISRSMPRILAERDHPLWLDIHGKPDSRVLRLPLKTCKKRDVEWLLSLPQLKVRS